MNTVYYDQYWRLRYRSNEPHRTVNEVDQFLIENGYEITSRTGNATKSYTTLKRSTPTPLSGNPDWIQCEATPKAAGPSELRIRFGLSANSIATRIRVRILLGALVILTIIPAVHWNSLPATTYLALTIAWLIAIVIHVAFIGFDCSAFSRKQLRLIQKLTPRITSFTHSRNLDAIPPLDDSPEIRRVSTLLWCIDFSSYLALTAVAQFYWGTLVVFIGAAAILSFRHWMSEHSKFALIVSNLSIAFIIVLPFLTLIVTSQLELMTLPKGFSFARYMKHTEARIDGVEALAGQHSILSEDDIVDTLARDLAHRGEPVYRDSLRESARLIKTATKEEIITEVSEARSTLQLLKIAALVFISFIAVALTITAINIPDIIQWRDLIFQRTENIGPILRAAIGTSLITYTALFLLTVLVYTFVSLSMFATSQTTTWNLVLAIHNDISYFFESAWSLCLSNERSHSLAWWSTLAFTSLLPTLYIVTFTGKLFLRIRLCRRLARGQTADARCKHIMSQLLDGRAQCVPIVSVNERPNIFAQSHYFPMQGRYVIEISKFALRTLSDPELKGLLAHEYKHIQTDVSKLYIADWLSCLTFLGSGMLYALMDTHNMEYEADAMAAQSLDIPNGVDIYCRLLERIYATQSVGGGSRFDPAAGIHSKRKRTLRSWAKNCLHTYHSFLGSDTPYVHPSLANRQDRLREGPRNKCVTSS